jgi:hypothetical protein
MDSCIPKEEEEEEVYIVYLFSVDSEVHSLWYELIHLSNENADI